VLSEEGEWIAVPGHPSLLYGAVAAELHAETVIKLHFVHEFSGSIAAWNGTRLSNRNAING
jgi:hypothetical protein